MLTKCKNIFVILIILSLSLFIVTGQGLAAKSFALYASSSIPITDWDPSVEYSNGIVTMHNIYETLLRYDPLNDEFEKLLATDYTKSEDGLTWTFDIRKGVKFHDGTELDARAVKFSIDRTMEMGKGASFIWSPVNKIEVLDKYTVQFKLAYPAPLNMIVSASYGSFIMSPQAVKNNENFFEDPNECGTGPYKLEASKSGEEIILSRFEDYWGGWNENQFDKAVIKRVPQVATRRQLIASGNADITVRLPHEDVEPLKKNSKVKVKVTPAFENTLLFFNTNREPLNNKLVRKALSYAFPYQDVISAARGGYARQSKGPIPYGLWGHGENLKQYEKNIEKAKELLKKAGYYEEGFELLLTYLSGSEQVKKMAELYRAELDKINVKLDIRGMPWQSQWSLAKSKKKSERQDILIMNWWPDLADPYSFLNSMFHSEDKPLFNMAYWENQKFDKLIDEAYEISGIDIEKAQKMYIDAQEILIEEAPAIFAFDKKYVRYINKELKGYKDNPLYPSVVFFYDLYRE